jgi:hypothetical protein
MKTTWKYSLETEAKRLIQCSHQIAVGFYRVNGFIVLPHTHPQDGQTIAFPEINYLSIPRFWDRCKKIDIGTKLPFSIPADLTHSLALLLEKCQLSPPDLSSIEKLWSKYDSQILSLIEDLIPAKKGWIKNIQIYPTTLGSITSFNYLDRPGAVHMWLRQDAGISNIVEAIITAITRDDVYRDLNFTWNESEAVADWILAYSPISTLLKKIDSTFSKSLTLKSTRNTQRASLTSLSQKFLSKIGAPVVDISTVRKIDLSNFTAREKQLFELLINRSPNLVTTDEISEIIFPQNMEAFSLYAIAKSIQRLRDKLEQNGISGSFIQTKRGAGYLLAN